MGDNLGRVLNVITLEENLHTEDQRPHRQDEVHPRRDVLAYEQEQPQYDPGGAGRAPLFFADAQRFHDELSSMVSAPGREVKAVVIDGDAIRRTDTDGVDIVITIAKELEATGISLSFARVDLEVRRLWEPAGVLEAVGPECFFPTVRAAMEAVASRTVFAS
jgi:hypothetical protein